MTDQPSLKVVEASNEDEVKAKVPDAVTIKLSRNGEPVKEIRTGNNALAMYTELAEDLPEDLKDCEVEIESRRFENGKLSGTAEAVTKVLEAEILAPDRLVEAIKEFVDKVLYRTPARLVSVAVHLGESNPSPIITSMSASVPVSTGDCKGFVMAIDALRSDFVTRAKEFGVEIDDKEENLIVPATSMPGK